jgi:hypothetical protein
MDNPFVCRGIFVDRFISIERQYSARIVNLYLDIVIFLVFSAYVVTGATGWTMSSGTFQSNAQKICHES